MQSFSNSDTYRRFVKARDQTLEQLLKKAYIKTGNAQRELFIQWVYVCLHAIAKSNQVAGPLSLTTVKRNLDQMDQLLTPAVIRIQAIIMQLRKSTYILTVSSEAEAIGQALGKPTRYTISKEKLDQIINAKSPKSGADFSQSITYTLLGVMDKLKRMALWIAMQPEQNISNDEMLKYLISKLPKTKDLESMKKVLKPIKAYEANRQPVPDISVGYFDDEDWENVLSDLKSEFSVNRGPESFVMEKPPGSKQEVPVYSWEIEQEYTHDFVVAVRKGVVDAANQNGINDFIWIAVLDDRTCESCCGDFGCADFDGKLTSEIEKMTKGYAVVPPAHFNCRCQIAPANKDDMPTVPESNEKEFDAWLNS